MTTCLYPHWQAMADNYKAWENQGMTPSTLNPFSEYFCSPVLLIGSGAGSTLEHLLKKGFKVNGVDQSPGMCQIANARIGPYVIQALGHNLPFSDNSFNTVIVTTGVLDIDHQIGRQKILTEASRILSINGKLLISVYYPSLEMQHIGNELGIMSGLRFHQQRVCQFWQAKGNIEAWADLISKFRAISVSQARTIACEYEFVLSTIQMNLDNTALQAKRKNIEPETHLQDCLDYDIQGWSEADYSETLFQLGFHKLMRRIEPMGPTLNMLFDHNSSSESG